VSRLSDAENSNYVLTVATLLSRNANNAMVEPAFCGSLESSGRLCVVLLAGIWLESREDIFTLFTSNNFYTINTIS
jgi:hypothetical protein